MNILQEILNMFKSKVINVEAYFYWNINVIYSLPLRTSSKKKKSHVYLFYWSASQLLYH